MDTVKKVFQFLSSVLFYSIVILLIVVALMVVSYYIDQQIGLKQGEKRSPLFGAYIIISESMVPSINVYDAVVTMRADESEIEVDDIITFISKEIETAGTPITHRVIGIVYDENQEKVIGYRTKGDSNNTEDFALIAPDEVIGKVMFRIPMIGYLQTVMTKPIGWILIVVLPCLLIIGSDVYKLITRNRSVEEEKEVAISTENILNAPEVNPVPIKSIEITAESIPPDRVNEQVSTTQSILPIDNNMLSSHDSPVCIQNTTTNEITSDSHSNDDLI